MGWWDNQYGNQLRISGVGTFASALLTTLSAFQLMFLQDNVDYLGDLTGVAIVLIVVGGIGLAVSAPAFLNLSARANTLNMIMAKKSMSELRKLKPDGDEAARILGGGHLEAWNAFLQEKGLKKR
ncbi:hypothetical protein N9U68_01225 [Euryarchaeota archaeon]|nr:hypothetical protein [Euryarchaeota archaeon]